MWVWILAAQEFSRYAYQTAHKDGKGSESRKPANSASCQYSQAGGEMADRHQSCSICAGVKENMSIIQIVNLHYILHILNQSQEISPGLISLELYMYSICHFRTFCENSVLHVQVQRVNRHLVSATE